MINYLSYLVEEEFLIDIISVFDTSVWVLACPFEASPYTSSNLENSGTKFPVKNIFRVNVVHDATTPPTSLKKY
jgi:hypothetical protein